MTISDEKLIAFMDGELTQSETDRISHMIAASADLTERLQLLTATDKRLLAAFKAHDNRPIRADTLEMIDKATADSSAATGQNILPFERQANKSEAANDNSPWIGQAVAAALALAIGFGSGAMLYPGAERQENSQDSYSQQIASVVAPQSPLFAVLERTPSATTVQLDKQDKSATPLATFLTEEQGYCREFSVQSADASSRNLACRAQGTWTVVASVWQPGTNAPDAGAYITASQSGSQLLDEMILEWMEGDILDASDEAMIIARSWK